MTLCLHGGTTKVIAMAGIKLEHIYNMLTFQPIVALTYQNGTVVPKCSYLAQNQFFARLVNSFLCAAIKNIYHL